MTWVASIQRTRNSEYAGIAASTLVVTPLMYTVAAWAAIGLNSNPDGPTHPFNVQPTVVASIVGRQHTLLALADVTLILRDEKRMAPVVRPAAVDILELLGNPSSFEKYTTPEPLVSFSDTIGLDAGRRMVALAFTADELKPEANTIYPSTISSAVSTTVSSDAMNAWITFPNGG
jgi:hypothetical protein